MASRINRLSARKVQTINKPGRHADGGNLYLNVTSSGARSWVFLYTFDGRQREMGLGSLHNVPLAQARELAAACRLALAAGRAPRTVRAQSKPTTFGDMADELIASMEKSWRNAKHRAQWRMTLSVYAAPLRKKSIDKITTEDVLQVLKGLWHEKPETASRLRGRIEAVLNAAKAKGLRSGENPARWRGHLDSLLPKRSALTRTHHAALERDKLPGFLEKLREQNGISAKALEFTILTAARSGEVLGTRWPEIDFDKKIWTVPAERMKGGREHRVPLSCSALAILKEMSAVKRSDYVFPGTKADKPLSGMALEMAMRRLKADATPHGFRSTFRDWAAEETNASHEVCEMALAHTIASKVEAAYRRGDLFEKRRQLMDDWAAFCGQKPRFVTEENRAADTSQTVGKSPSAA